MADPGPLDPAFPRFRASGNSVMRILIGCGGTGGHIYPALAIAEALRAQDPRTEILFVGGGGIGSRIISESGWPFRRIAARQFSRRAPGAAVAVGVLAWGTLQSLSLLWRLRPHAVVVTGGYASAPVGLAAAVLRIPLILQEQNLSPGLANRVLARWAAEISVSHEEARLAFRRPAVVTGVPIRAQAIHGDRGRGLARYGLQSGVTTVLVLGGSQGARSLNEAVLDAIPHLHDPDAVQILHQTGRAHAAGVSARTRQLATPRYVAVGYIDDVADAYACADLLVCRAGAATLAEATANGLPIVAVPFPHATGGHQETNARVLERQQAAIVLRDAGLSGRALAEVIDRLRDDPIALAAMAAASRRAGRPEAAAQVATLIHGVAA